MPLLPVVSISVSFVKELLVYSCKILLKIFFVNICFINIVELFYLACTMRRSPDITQFAVAIAMNCQVLTHCMNISYGVGHK
jgi:hypothetical protein